MNVLKGKMPWTNMAKTANGVIDIIHQEKNKPFEISNKKAKQN
jgi:hypothetical protein